MANLETLELTISANAESASQGVGQLTRSLSALSAAVGKSVGGLMRLNAELKTLKGFGRMKLPNIGSVSGASAVARGAKNKVTTDYDPLTNNNRTYTPAKQTAASIKADNEWKRGLAEASAEANRRRFAAYPEERQNELLKRFGPEFFGLKKVDASQVPQAAKDQYKPIVESAKEVKAEISGATEAAKEFKQETEKTVEPIKEVSKASDLEAAKMAKVSAQTEKLNAETEKLKVQTAKLKEQTEEIGKMDKPISKVASAASGLLSSIGRIFKTMLIRTAIRALLKAAKEGLDNYYQYSQKVGNSFADTMNKLHNKWGQFKNQLGAAIGTGLKAILPLLNAIASAAIVALNTITALFALISGSDTYTVAVEGMEEYGEEIKKTGKAASEWIATFDELNVMTKNSGGGTGGATEDIASMFKEVPLPDWMVEWKPLIEAILAGVLGATILPKIWDWVSKIFKLFGGGDAKDAIDILKKMKDLDDTDFSVPTEGVDDFLGKFKDSDVLDGIGDVSDLLSTLTKLDWKKLLIENLPALLSLAISLLTKLINGLNTTSKISIDREEFDQYKEDFEKFAKDNKEKTIKVNVDPDVATITRLTKWISADDTKVISVKIDKDAAALTSLTLWLAKEDTKVIKVKIDNDIAGITKITGWVATVDTKTIKVKVDPDIATITKITGWVATVDEKVIAVKLSEKEYAVFEATKDIIQLWVDTVGSKQIGIGFSPVSFVAFAIEMAALEVWVGTMPTKYIVVKIVDNNEVLLHLTNWINTEDTKHINIQFDYKMNSNSSSGSTSENGGDWFSDVIDEVGRWLGMSVNEMINEAFGTSLPKGFIPEFVDYVKGHKGTTSEKVDVDVSELVNTTNWSKLELDEKLKFLDMLKKTYGSNEAKNLIKEKGINIGQALQYGMQSREPQLRQIATEWADLIKQKTESKPPIITPSLNQPATNNIASNVQRTVQSAKPTVTPNLYVSYTDIQNDIVDPIENATATTKVEPELDKYAWDSNVMGYIKWEYAELTVNTELNEWSLRQNVLWPIEDCDPKITVDVDSSGVYSLSKSLKNALSSTIKLKLPDGTYVSGVKIVAAATGGLFDSGDLFIANEDGTSEMVGRFGNQTGVANQQEIISGIRKGVADANNEQNALLREQNKLLMGILNKESTVQIGASSLLGRTVQQSLNMYNAVTGRA